jgi:type I restriction enzyme S subunit
VPEHWGETITSALFMDNKKKNKGTRETNLLSLSYGNIIKKDINTNDGLLPETFEAYQIVYSGYIILRLTDLQNDKRSLRVGHVNEKGIITSAYTGLRKKSEAVECSKYFYYLLHTYDIIKVFYGMGGGVRQSLNFNELRKLRLLLPLPEEQRAIATFLDRETGRIDALLAKKERQIELLREKRAALISHAVTKGLDPDVPMKDSGVEWLGEVPEHWAEMRIKHLLHQIIDTEHKTAPYSPDSNYLVVRTSNVRNGILSFDDAKYTDSEGFKEWTRRGVPKPGDILFTREAPAGEACIVPDNVPRCIGQRRVLFRVNKQRLDARFGIYSIYGGLADEFIRSLSQGSTVEHFNMSDIGNTPLFEPSLSEQHTIAAFLDHEAGHIDVLTAKVRESITKLREYRTALISAAVTGKIDVRAELVS